MAEKGLRSLCIPVHQEASGAREGTRLACSGAWRQATSGARGIKIGDIQSVFLLPWTVGPPAGHDGGAGEP
ncbi:unnamed protein product [Urochloa humidicola]